MGKVAVFDFFCNILCIIANTLFFSLWIYKTTTTTTTIWEFEEKKRDLIKFLLNLLNEVKKIIFYIVCICDEILRMETEHTMKWNLILKLHEWNAKILIACIVGMYTYITFLITLSYSKIKSHFTFRVNKRLPKSTQRRFFCWIDHSKEHTVISYTASIF